MTRLLVPFLLVSVALSCYSNSGGATEDERDSGEVAAVEEVNLDMVADFNSDLKYAQVTEVKATLEQSGSWRFDVTVRHDDEGWGHYADLWEVVDPESSVLYGKRVLLHPHDAEQPFTRSQSGIEIPEGVSGLLIRARCTTHGFDGRAILVDLTAAEGNGFTVVR
jgi:hypothetical protein